MTSVQTAAIETKAVEELRGRSRLLLRPGEEGYDEARRVRNGPIGRRPVFQLNANIAPSRPP